MSLVPTFATAPSFLGAPWRASDPASTGFTVAGIPLDIGTTNRAGARSGPAAIRQASRMLVDGAHPTRWTDPQDWPLTDAGDFAIALGDIESSLRQIEAQASAIPHLVALGGEHGITLALLRALSKRLGAKLALVHFDAHVDTWPDNFGQTYGHGSVFFHAIREGIVDARRMVQIGIRSPVQRDVWDWTLNQGVTVLSGQEVQEMGPESVAQKIRAVVGDAPAYLSFDIDALDPAHAPGTGTPEIGGLASWQAQAILRRLDGIAFRGMDIVEVAPAFDTAEVTALAAATIAWEYLAMMVAQGEVRPAG
ncbi:agmatinase [Pseudoroseomonas globiformis]|uniref:Agmatinase n=1 Tax=Teichococcus globiformis TaxID=2307229 RepID=A0ABV7G4F4_9PROT